MNKNNLILGWELTPTLEPRYWLNSKAKPGKQNIADLVVVEPESIAAHTAIIAQSGSGKSYFLGRLIEEILVNTKSNCIILDPNADFKKANEVVNPELWDEAKYDIAVRKGKLPHENSRNEFLKEWSKVPICILTNKDEAKQPYKKIKLWWPSINVELISDDLEPIIRSELYHCHRFVKAIARLCHYKCQANSSRCDILKESKKYLKMLRDLEPDERGKKLQAEFDADKLGTSKSKTSFSIVSQMSTFLDIYNKQVIYSQIMTAVSASEYISDTIAKYYFSKAREFDSAGIIDVIINKTLKKTQTEDSPKRLQVIDLPSLENKGARFMAVSSILNHEWSRVRSEWEMALKDNPNKDVRVPTFIVVDEAHNLIPAAPRNASEYSLREQFRTIIAEGRKYGLFLILVSQRPDKLDPLIISECENIALMKINSAKVLQNSKQLLGLDDLPNKLIEKCLDFPTGRVLLYGSWSNGSSKLLFSAARRTVEGGRNLRSEHWAVPFSDEITKR